MAQPHSPGNMLGSEGARRSSSRPRQRSGAWWETPAKSVATNKFVGGLQFHKSVVKTGRASPKSNGAAQAAGAAEDQAGARTGTLRDRPRHAVPQARANLQEAFNHSSPGKQRKAADRHVHSSHDAVLPPALAAHNAFHTGRQPTHRQPVKKAVVRKPQEQASPASDTENEEPNAMPQPAAKPTLAKKPHPLSRGFPVAAPAPADAERHPTAAADPAAADAAAGGAGPSAPAERVSKKRIKQKALAVQPPPADPAPAGRPKRATAQLAVQRLKGDAAAAPPDLFALPHMVRLRYALAAGDAVRKEVDETAAAATLLASIRSPEGKAPRPCERVAKRADAHVAAAVVEQDRPTDQGTSGEEAGAGTGDKAGKATKSKATAAGKERRKHKKARSRAEAAMAAEAEEAMEGAVAWLQDQEPAHADPAPDAERRMIISRRRAPEPAVSAAPVAHAAGEQARPKGDANKKRLRSDVQPKEEPATSVAPIGSPDADAAAQQPAAKRQRQGARASNAAAVVAQPAPIPAAGHAAAVEGQAAPLSAGPSGRRSARLSSRAAGGAQRVCKPTNLAAVLEEAAQEVQEQEPAQTSGDNAAAGAEQPSKRGRGARAGKSRRIESSPEPSVPAPGAAPAGQAGAVRDVHDIAAAVAAAAMAAAAAAAAAGMQEEEEEEGAEGMDGVEGPEASEGEEGRGEGEEEEEHADGLPAGDGQLPAVSEDRAAGHEDAGQLAEGVPDGKEASEVEDPARSAAMDAGIAQPSRHAAVANEEGVVEGAGAAPAGAMCEEQEQEGVAGHVGAGEVEDAEPAGDGYGAQEGDQLPAFMHAASGGMHAEPQGMHADAEMADAEGEQDEQLEVGDLGGEAGPEGEEGGLDGLQCEDPTAAEGPAPQEPQDVPGQQDGVQEQPEQGQMAAQMVQEHDAALQGVQGQGQAVDGLHAGSFMAPPPLRQPQSPEASCAQSNPVMVHRSAGPHGMQHSRTARRSSLAPLLPPSNTLLPGMAAGQGPHGLEQGQGLDYVGGDDGFEDIFMPMPPMGQAAQLRGGPQQAQHTATWVPQPLPPGPSFAAGATHTPGGHRVRLPGLYDNQLGGQQRPVSAKRQPPGLTAMQAARPAGVQRFGMADTVAAIQARKQKAMLDAAAAAASPLFMGDDYDPPVDEDEGMEELPAYMADEAQHDMGSVRGPHPSQQAQHGRMPAYAGGRCLGAQAEPEVHAQQQVQRQRQQQRAAQEQQQQQRQQLLARQDDNQGGWHEDGQEQEQWPEAPYAGWRSQQQQQLMQQSRAAVHQQQPRQQQPQPQQPPDQRAQQGAQQQGPNRANQLLPNSTMSAPTLLSVPVLKVGLHQQQQQPPRNQPGTGLPNSLQPLSSIGVPRLQISLSTGALGHVPAGAANRTSSNGGTGGSRLLGNPALQLLAQRAAAGVKAQARTGRGKKGGADSDAEDGWTEEQSRALLAAYQQVDPTHPRFWQEVAAHVPGHSAGECFTRMMDRHKTPEEKSKVPRPLRQRGGDDSGADSDEEAAGSSRMVQPVVPLGMGRKPTEAALRRWTREQHQQMLLQRAAATGGRLPPDLAQALAEKDQKDKYITRFLRENGGWQKWQRTCRSGLERRVHSELSSLHAAAQQGGGQHGAHGGMAPMANAIHAALHDMQDLEADMDDGGERDYYFGLDDEMEDVLGGGLGPAGL